MQYHQFISPNRWHRFVNHCRLVFAVLRLMNQQTELSRLVEWAGKRKFMGPYKAYTRKHQRLSVKLLNLRYRAPHHYSLAACLHEVSNWVSPHPRLVKGAGAAYKGI